MLEVNATLHTNGSGLWSNKVAAIRIVRLDVSYVSEEKDFGELCAHFHFGDWDVSQDGLIYTDKLFIKELRAYLTLLGLDATGVGYSEAGMQGHTCVSLDVGKEFLDSWFAKVNQEEPA